MACYERHIHTTSRLPPQDGFVSRAIPFMESCGNSEEVMQCSRADEQPAAEQQHVLFNQEERAFASRSLTTWQEVWTLTMNYYPIFHIFEQDGDRPLDEELLFEQSATFEMSETSCLKALTPHHTPVDTRMSRHLLRRTNDGQEKHTFMFDAIWKLAVLRSILSHTRCVQRQQPETRARAGIRRPRQACCHEPPIC